MNWWWTIFHSKFKLYIPYIIIIPWIVRKSTLIDATKLPPLFEGVSSSTREDTFCGKLVERGFQNRELSDAEEGLKELEGKTIKWHSTEGGEGEATEVSGCKLLSEFMAHSAFRPNYVQDRGDLCSEIDALHSCRRKLAVDSENRT